MTQTFSKARITHDKYLEAQKDYLRASSELEELDNKLEYVMRRLKEVEEKQHSDLEPEPPQQAVDNNIEGRSPSVSSSPTSSINDTPSRIGNEAYGYSFLHNSSESFF